MALWDMPAECEKRYQILTFQSLLSHHFHIFLIHVAAVSDDYSKDNPSAHFLIDSQLHMAHLTTNGSNKNGLYTGSNTMRAYLLPSFEELLLKSGLKKEDHCSIPLKHNEVAIQHRKVLVEEKKPRRKTKRRCQALDCQKIGLQGGFCIAHGGGRRCKHAGCTTAAQSGGLCKSHGGGSCKVPECGSVGRYSGYCVKHGGRNLCGFQNCTKTAHYRGLCFSHGGGRRCQMSDCNKSVQSRGLCYTHGGGKRCLKPGCCKGSRRDGFCSAHCTTDQSSTSICSSRVDL